MKDKNKDEFNSSVEARKTQEAVANLLAVSGEFAKCLHGLYISFRNAGFSEEQAMALVGKFMPKIEE